MVCVIGAVVATVATGGAAGALIAEGASGIASVAAGSVAGAAGSATGAGIGMAGGAAAVGAGAEGAMIATGTALGTSMAEVGVAATIVANPLALAIVGAAAATNGTSTYTWDCWKQVVHDNSTTASAGISLKDLLADIRVKHCAMKDETTLVVTNVWNEQFRVVGVRLPCGQLALHASAL